MLFSSYARSQVIDFADSNFENHLLENGTDTNNDGKIDINEAGMVDSLNLRGKGITSLEGINYFTSLDTLDAGENLLTNFNGIDLIDLNWLFLDNNNISDFVIIESSEITRLGLSSNQITALNVNEFINLEVLSVDNNLLEELDVSNLTKLESLSCGRNEISQLHLGNLPELKNLHIFENNLDSLDLSQLENLINFGCSRNNFKKLDMSNLSNLKTFSAFACELESLILPTNSVLNSINVDENDFKKLDIDSNISALRCEYNELEEIIIKNPSETFITTFIGNPDLEYFCIPDEFHDQINDQIEEYGYDDVVVNSSCTTSIKEQEESNSKILIYPTLASEFLTIVSQNPIEKIKVYDVSGHLILNFTTSSDTHVDVSLEALNSGIYFIKCWSGTKSLTQRFFKL